MVIFVMVHVEAHRKIYSLKNCSRNQGVYCTD
nr:MAG TPA: hypothetical protein [Caudoviricetes sp.]